MRQKAFVASLAAAVAIALAYGGPSRNESTKDHGRKPSADAHSKAAPANTPPPSVGAKDPHPAPDPRISTGGAFAEISETARCYESQNCDFPRTDPKAYDYAVGQKLASQLRATLKLYGNSPEHSAELEDLVKIHLTSSDPFVQSAALEIMSALPPEVDNLKVLASAIEDSSDPDLVTSAMGEMKRYLGTSGEPLIHSSLMNIMKQGAHFSGQATAQGILPFINSQSYSLYSATADALTPGSKTASFLRSALDEYQRQIHGG